MVDKPSSELLSATVSEPQDEMGDVVHASVGQVHLLSHLWRWDEESIEVGVDDDVTWRKLRFSSAMHFSTPFYLSRLTFSLPCWRSPSLR